MAQTLESIAMSTEGIPAGNYETLDVYTSGAMAMFCYTCIPHMHEHLFGSLPGGKPLGDITIEPYKRGMGLDGGLNLYGDKNTAIFNDPTTGLDIHHHNSGGGMAFIGSDPLMRLPWEIQTKLPDYFKK